MAQRNRRHWSIFLGIWSLAALSLLLYLPIFRRTFYFGTLPDQTRPDVYLRFLEADLMWIAPEVGGSLTAVAEVEEGFTRILESLAVDPAARTRNRP